MRSIYWFFTGWVSFGVSMVCVLINVVYARIQQMHLQTSSQMYSRDVFAYTSKPFLYLTIVYGALSFAMIFYGLFGKHRNHSST